MYGGKPLSAWVDEMCALNHLANVVNTNHPEVRAVRAIGTNAIPWLLSELVKAPALPGRDNQTNLAHRVSDTNSPFATNAQFHQLRARAGFWALGELGAPAIPNLVSLLEQEPEFAPSALAGIGPPALPALERCLTNVPPHIGRNDPRAHSVGSAIGGLYVALDTGRISKSEAAYLLPTIRGWAHGTNRDAAYWADGVLKELGFEH